MPSDFENQMIASALAALYAQFGEAAVYTAPDLTTANVTIRAQRQPFRETERDTRGIGEMQTAEIEVRQSELAKPLKDARFTLDHGQGNCEVWTIVNTPVLQNGQYKCACARVGTERLMPRREVSHA